jgi:uncharacterized membrane protein
VDTLCKLGRPCARHCQKPGYWQKKHPGEIILTTAPFDTTPRATCHPRTLVTAALSCAALLSALAAGPAQAQSYPVYTVTALPGVSGVTAFNDSGLILGRGFVPCTGQICTQSDVPVLYDTRTGVMTALGSASGARFDAINAQGQLAGSTIARDASGALVRSVVIRQVDGALTTLPPPALSATQNSGLRARGFNRAGQIALQHSDGIDAQGPFCGNYQGWIGNGASAAGWQPLGSADTVMHLSGMNVNGLAVGAAVAAANCGGPGGGFHATAAQPTGALIDLHGNMPGSFSRANAINDLGYAVGDYDTGARTLPDTNNPQGMPITRAAVWNTAAQAWFDVGPAASLSRLNAVNNRGEVVGLAYGSVTAGQPYTNAPARAMLGNLATNWPMVDLNTLLANNTAGWVMENAVAINASGQIVASTGSGYALLTPVSAPADPYATAPSAPASLAASELTASSAVLTWTNTARNATRLLVERCKGNHCTSFVTIATLPSDTARFSDTNLTRRTTYRWRVRADNAAGLSAASNRVTATTLR